MAAADLAPRLKSKWISDRVCYRGQVRDDAATDAASARLTIPGRLHMTRSIRLAGVEDGARLIGGSLIVDPNAMIRAQARALETS
jgi:hypothetical protein